MNERIDELKRENETNKWKNENQSQKQEKVYCFQTKREKKRKMLKNF